MVEKLERLSFKREPTLVEKLENKIIKKMKNKKGEIGKWLTLFRKESFPGNQKNYISSLNKRLKSKILSGLFLTKIKNKQGEIGETITWMIATIIIIVVLLVSVFFVSAISKTNDLKKPHFYDEANFYSASNSLISYALTNDDSDKIIYEGLLTKSFSSFSGSFAVEVFKNRIYKDKYSEVWVGFGSESSNEYFGDKTLTKDFVSKIKLRDVDEFELRLQK